MCLRPSDICFQSLTSAFFGIAMLASATRIFVRTYCLRKVSVDDYPFYLAVASLITSSSIFFLLTNSVSLISIFDDGLITPLPSYPQELVGAVFYVILGDVLCWLTIFAVKFSFLFYFRALVRRLPKVERWWWITLAILVPVAITATFGTLIVCAPKQFSFRGSHATFYDGLDLVADCIL